MSLRRNLIANYAGQLYVTTAGIVLVPLYIRYMGAEAYGLVGFFAMLQAWFNLLDMGLTPTMARETARFHGGALDVMGYRRLVRALEGVFLAVALCGGLSLFMGAGWVANRWLKVDQLPIAEIGISLRLMAVIVALRWMCGLYRGAITGAERLVWLSGFNSAVATLRFVLIIPVLIFVSASPVSFFGFQLAVAVVEIAGLMWMTYRLLPAIPSGQRIRWEWAPLKPVLMFSLSIAFTSSVWVLVTQTDKLVLSRLLPLSDYGYFTVAVLVASGIVIMSGPVSGAIMPRMTRLQTEGQHKQLIDVYRLCTQLVTVISMPIALVLALFSRQVLWAWTGDDALAEKAAPILTLYAAGYGVLSVSAFPYYLQYAKGDLRLHLVGNALFVVVLIPSVIWAASYHGAIGAGWAWFLSNLAYLLLWTPLVHRRFAPRLHLHWLFGDIFRPTLLALAGAIVGTALVTWAKTRIILVLELMAATTVLWMLACFQAGSLKRIILERLRMW